MSSASRDEHPERILVRRAIDEQLKGVLVTTNPLAIALGMTLLEAREAYVRAGFTVDERFTQGTGVVQGGIVSAMLDFAMVFAAFSAVPAHAVVATVAQTTHYFRATPVGQLVVDADLEKVGRTLINARATLYDADRRALASATAVVIVSPA